MAQYNPKSKYEIREASAGEFIFKSNRQPYIGFYIEISSGKFYAGSDPKNLASEIIRPKPIPNNFGKTRDVAKYNVLNKSTYGQLKKVKNVVPVKNIPTEDDYKSNKYTRYFIKKVNERFGYIEVDKKTYDAINEEKEDFNYPVYDVGQIIWFLVGNVKKINSAQIFLLREKFPDLGVLFPKLDEFKKVEDRAIQNLFTEGGELYYEDGREYKGPYHIHPGKGPMVGAIHIKGQHDILYYEKPEQTQEVEGILMGEPVTPLSEIAPDYIQEIPPPVEESNVPSIIPEPISPTTTPSLGGGGGY
jgi:hypothetical protein